VSSPADFSLLDRATLEQMLVAGAAENERLRGENVILTAQVSTLQRDLGEARKGAKALREELARRDARAAAATPKTSPPPAPAPAGPAGERFSLLEVDMDQPKESSC